MKFKTHICLSIATGLGCGAKFDEMHECITHVLGWDVFTHELADKGVWARANKLVLAAQPSLVPYDKRLRLVAPDILYDEITIDDPVVLEEPVTYTLAYRRAPGYKMVEFVCDNNREYVDENGIVRLRLGGSEQ